MRRKLDALLVLPPMYHSGRMPDYNPKEPMGLMYLAAELRRRGLEVEILDADLLAYTIERTIDEIVRRDAAVIGFSVLQRALPSLKLIVEGIRERGVRSHVCCGGVGASLSALKILGQVRGVDSIVMGDGEFVFADLVNDVLAGRPWQRLPGLCYRDVQATNFTPRAEKPNLDNLSPPVRDMLSVCLDKTGYATVVGSRGCYAACTFCSNSGYEKVSCGPGWRGRDPVSVVDEIEFLHREYGVTAFKFNDPNLYGPGRAGKEHVSTLCRELMARKLDNLSLMAFTRASDLDDEGCRMLRSAGFERMLIGIETFDRAALKSLRKGETVDQILTGIRCLKDAGISIVPGFIIFNPYSTLDTLISDLDMLDRFGFAVTLAKSMRIFDGTALARVMAEESRLIRKSPFLGYHEYTVDPGVAAAYMSLKVLSVEWMDPMTRHHQDSLWDIKKAASFNEREQFYSLQGTIYRIESKFLRSVISLLRDGYSREAISGMLSWAKRQLTSLEATINGRCEDSSYKGLSSGFSIESLTDKISDIVLDRPYETFPEKYRWAND
jgi:radical SAM superfamily enzyme YgiQ (UPF0313 family)